MTPGKRAARWVSGAVAVSIAGAAWLGPLVPSHLDRWRLTRRLDDLAATGSANSPSLVLSAQPSNGSTWLSSWQTIGGCGAGGSGSGGSAVKWIGRNVRGGLFNVTQTMNYLRLYGDPQGTEFRSGYNFISNTQIGRDLSETVSGAVVIPLLYKYYGDVLHNDLVPGYDVSNGGLGDINLLGMLKLGAIHDTILTFTLGLPTGEHKGENPRANAYLTQEKQLGFGKMTGSLMLDHTFDQIWGLMVVGGSVGYRGGINDLESYRAPNASLYGHIGYYAGPFVPSVGLTLTGFLDRDKDQNSAQNTPRETVAASAAVEWSNDYVALLLGATLPYGGGFDGTYAVLPWTITLGVAVSPF